MAAGSRETWLAAILRSNLVYVPTIEQENVHWHRLAEADLKPGALNPGLRRIRASEPVKSFLFGPREKVASFPEPAARPEPATQVLFGVKNCDLVPLKVHQRILAEGDFKDPFYAARRKSTVLVAADCPAPEESCFCNLLGLTPYPGEGADVVLSAIDDFYLLEPVTDAGRDLVRLAGDAARPATAAQAAKRDEERRDAAAVLAAQNPRPWNTDLAGAIARRLGDKAFWQKHAETCVECLGCLFACPTCYCFLLYDQAREKGLDRTRIWDACYEAAYTRVGGGANPRGEFLKRFINRFECKWKEFKRDHGFYACSGCGRCFKVCMGKIDIRDVLGAV